MKDKGFETSMITKKKEAWFAFKNAISKIV